MTDNPTKSSDDDEADEVQLGARVDKDLAELVKGLVQHKHGKTRGPLGDSYEKALEYYLGVHVIQHPDDIEKIAATSDIEDKEKAITRLREAVDSVGPELMGVKQSLESTEQVQNRPPERPIAQTSPPQKSESFGTVLSVKEGWERSPVRQAVLDDTSHSGEDLADQVAEKIIESDEFADKIEQMIRENN